MRRPLPRSPMLPTRPLPPLPSLDCMLAALSAPRPSPGPGAVRAVIALLLSALWALALPVAAAERGGRTADRLAERDPWVDVASVVGASGDIALVRGASIRTPLRDGTALRVGDRIITGADGRLALRFVDEGLIALQPNTEFRIDAFRFDERHPRSTLGLVRGALRAVTGAIGRRAPEQWKLETPTATIGVRGTEFVVRETRCPPAGCVAGEDPGLRVTVIRGRIVVANAAGSAEVPAGRSLSVRDAASDPAAALPLPAVPGAPSNGARRPRPAAPADPFGPTPVEGSGLPRALPAGPDPAASIAPPEPLAEDRAVRGDPLRPAARTSTRTRLEFMPPSTQ